ncbi:MAG: TlpA disulfide reductase family protein [Pseudomonadota bacterium]
MKTFLMLIGVAVLALALGLVAGRFLREPPPVPTLDTSQGMSVGDAMPAFRHADINGQLVSHEDFAGQPVLVNFWATWCAPCVREMPMFQDYAESKADRLQLVGIAIDEPGNVREFVEELGISYTILIGTTDVMQTQQAFGNANGMLPYTVFVDAAGIVRWQHLGEVKPEHLEEHVTPSL